MELGSRKARIIVFIERCTSLFHSCKLCLERTRERREDAIRKKRERAQRSAIVRVLSDAVTRKEGGETPRIGGIVSKEKERERCRNWLNVERSRS